jgi:hypothetical protein
MAFHYLKRMHLGSISFAHILKSLGISYHFMIEIGGIFFCNPFHSEMTRDFLDTSHDSIMKIHN